MTKGAKYPGTTELQPDEHPYYSSTTPPERETLLPPTPPATGERLGGAFDASKNGLMHMLHERLQSIAEPFTRILIDKRQYDSQEIEKLVRRHDYEPTNNYIIIRMPSTIHEYFLKSFERIVQDQLQIIAERGGTYGNFASEISSVGSARIFLAQDNSYPRGPMRRQPDAQFQHSQATYPGVVVEVSYSQDGKSLRKLAQDYILESSGNIRAVIGIDINPVGKESSVSLWRPKYTPLEGENSYILEAGQEVSCKAFRTSGGSLTNQEEQLALSLSDFATDEVSSGHEDVLLSVGYNKLYDFLIRAEQLQLKRESGTGVQSGRRVKKRRHSSSSVAHDYQKQTLFSFSAP